MVVRLLIVVAIFSGGLSCATLNGQKPRLLTLIGEFAGHPGTPVQVMLDYDPVGKLDGATVARSKSDAAGKFEIKFRIAREQALVLLMGRNVFRFWAVPGQDLKVTRRKDRWGFVSLSNENRILDEIGLIQSSPVKIGSGFKPNQFAKSVDRRTNEQQKKLNAFCRESNVSDRFVLYARAQIIGSAACEKNMRPKLLEMQKKFSAKDLPANYHDFWKTFPILDDEAGLLSRKYLSALQGKFQYLARRSLEKSGTDVAGNPGVWVRKELEIQAAMLTRNPRTHELLFAEKIKFMIQYFPRQDTLAAMEQFKKHFPESRYLQQILAALADTRKIDLEKLIKRFSFVMSTARRWHLPSCTGKWFTWISGGSGARVA